jgi:uncharacterized membrane protein YgcG
MNIQTLYRPLALLSIISMVMASVLTTSSVSADSNAAQEVPHGQMTRRAVSGTIASISPFVVETKFGNVTIDVTSSTIIRAGGEEFDDLQPEHVGAKVGVLLDKSPDQVIKSENKDDDDEDNDGDDDGDGVDLSAPSDGDDTGTDPDLTPPPTTDDTGTDPDLTPPPTTDDTDTDPELTPPSDGDDSGTDPDLTPPSDGDDSGTDTEKPEPKKIIVQSFRQDVTALRISIVPVKATRKHECVVVTATGEGTTTVLDEDGNETELEGDAGAEGEDICLLTKGKKGGGKKITGSADPGSVDDRLTRLAEKNAELSEKLEEKKAEREAKREERLEKTVNNAPEDKKGKAQGAKDKNTNRGSGSSGSGSSGSGSSGGGSGSSGNSGSSGGSSGNSGGGSSGGNSGNSGGGNSGSGGGPPEDKGKKPK